MKTYISILVMLLSFNYGNSQLENDKVLHFTGGSLFGLAGAGIAKQISNGDRYWTFVGSVGGALLVGIGKEALDAGQEGNRWDNSDILATGLGGVAVGFTIDIFTNKKRKNKGNRANLIDDDFYTSVVNTSLNYNILNRSSSIIYTE